MTTRLRSNIFPIIIGLIYLTTALVNSDLFVKSLSGTWFFIKEMVFVMPVILILTALVDAWVPREAILRGFGEHAGIKGTILSFVLGSFSAGPVYAAFPVCQMLLSKGASLSNVVIVLSAWAVIKVPMLANEAKFLGLSFMSVRWVLTVIAIIAMAGIVGKIVPKGSVPSLSRISHKPGEINSAVCMGCGLCATMAPEAYTMVAGKATRMKDHPLNESDTLAASSCPVGAIWTE